MQVTLGPCSFRLFAAIFGWLGLGVRDYLPIAARSRPSCSPCLYQVSVAASGLPPVARSLEGIEFIIALFRFLLMLMPLGCRV